MYTLLVKTPREWKDFLKQEADRRNLPLTGMFRQIIFEWIEGRRRDRGEEQNN